MSTQRKNCHRSYTTKSEVTTKSGKKKTVKKAKIGSVLRGEASYYGPGLEGNLTANGEVFNSSEMTCAHKSLPFNTWLRVTREDTGESVVVRVNDFRFECRCRKKNRVR